LPDAAPPAVVIGLDSITGLQTARILADHGVAVVGVVADRRHWGAHTNACVGVVESPLTGEDLVSALVDLGVRLGRAVLVPCTDGSVDTLSRHRSRLGERFVLPLSPHATVERLMDKVPFASHAAELGLPIPRTEVVRNREQLDAVADTVAEVHLLARTHQRQGLRGPGRRRAAEALRARRYLVAGAARPGVGRRWRGRVVLVQRLLR
jgi:D-aspartate ligase